ncbi:Subtilisin-like protease 4 [Linum perenne]
MLPVMSAVSSLCIIFFVNFISHSAAQRAENTTENLESDLETYIVHVNQPDGTTCGLEDLEAWHQSFLPIVSTSKSRDDHQRLLYSYQDVISGFSARLTKEELTVMELKDGFVSAHPEKTFYLQTTHSPHFLGLDLKAGLWKQTNYGSGVIIGVLDTGASPTHPSFNGKGMSPPPPKWKGKCEFKASHCNNKLIGARTFNLGVKARKGGKPETPTDQDGHGTHTASTAAGAFVKNANVFGNAMGTAAGMAPGAHVAIYKVCSHNCLESDILAGMDAAIHDGVDVISISLGADPGVQLYKDSISVGALAATQKGILVSIAAGNSGPGYSTLSSEAPWLLTVGASTIDRKVVATAKLGNGQTYVGESLYQPRKFHETPLPLVYAGINKRPLSELCGKGSLRGMNVKGKVVLCERGVVDRLDKGKEVKRAGGAAMILANGAEDGFSTLADPHVLPATHVSYESGQKIKAYINSTKTPTATILFKGTTFGDTTAPAVTSFSSRGPTLICQGILKPDIIGPGVSILAAWPSRGKNKAKREPAFSIESGTSMACPHLSGIAALLKHSHPTWSPAAIKSAIMTTADIKTRRGTAISDFNNQPADLFAIGSGQVNPSKANDPGLIYDIHPAEYTRYLCGLGYTDKQVQVITRMSINCKAQRKLPAGQLNYPSLSVTLHKSSQELTRTVTNVGKANASYYVKVTPPIGVLVTVKPTNLHFTKVGQRAKYSVSFTLTNKTRLHHQFAQGYLLWVSSAKHSVRSPISVQFN